MRSSDLPALTDDQLIQLASWLPDAGARSDLDAITTVIHLLDRYAARNTIAALLAGTSTEHTNVALQFPDALLGDAPLVTEALSQLADAAPDRTFLFFILGDTSYGECCVDEVAAQHLATHVVVHYGNSCLSPTRTLPALYVFPAGRLADPSRAARTLRRAVEHALEKTKPDRLVLLYDTDLAAHIVPSGSETAAATSLLLDGLDSLPVPVVAARLAVDNAATILQPGPRAWPDSVRRVGPHVFDTTETPLQRTAFLWLTGPAAAAAAAASGDTDAVPAAAQHAALALCTGPEPSLGFCTASVCDDAAEENSSGGARVVDASRVLRKRFAKLRHITSATRVGILPGTLGASGASAAIARCKRLIREAGKRAYVVLVGKPNVAKLANFEEIDVFVLVACPFTALLLDEHEYMQPIVTPVELEAALVRDGDLFSTPYSTDWRTFLCDAEGLDAAEQADGGASEEASDKLVPRQDWQVAVNEEGSAAEFLRQRSWTGLRFDKGGRENDTDLNELPVLAEQGQSGRAAKYDREANGPVNGGQDSS